MHVYMYVSLRDYDFKVEGRLPMATIKLHFSWEIGGPVSLIVYVCACVYMTLCVHKVVSMYMYFYMLCVCVSVCVCAGDSSC